MQSILYMVYLTVRTHLGDGGRHFSEGLYRRDLHKNWNFGWKLAL